MADSCLFDGIIHLGEVMSYDFSSQTNIRFKVRGNTIGGVIYWDIQSTRWDISCHLRVQAGSISAIAIIYIYIHIYMYIYTYDTLGHEIMILWWHHQTTCSWWTSMYCKFTGQQPHVFSGIKWGRKCLAAIQFKVRSLTNFAYALNLNCCENIKFVMILSLQHGLLNQL